MLLLLQALARAVYSRRPLLLLDDSLAGLDNLSEQHIVGRLLGPVGLLRQLGTTVVLATQTGMYMYPVWRKKCSGE
jgi:ABC-type bacteriocin/lantibiotic exporter with double-glycine peptidase domain